jgi:MerR family transcriptional regulator, redox-sensitive transcriptional activator SoxR
MEFWQRASHCWQEALDERISRLEQLRDRFTRCIGCGCLSFAEGGMLSQDDKLSAEGPGPHLLGSR